MRLRIAILALGLGLAAGLSGCAGDGAGGAGGGISAGGDDSGRGFLRRLEGRGLTLPEVVSFSEFAAASRGMGVTDPEGFLASMGVSVRGAAGGRWISRADLLRACGGGCNPREGLGELLIKLTVVFHRRN